MNKRLQSEIALLGVAHGSRNKHSAEITNLQIQTAAESLKVAGYVAYLEDFSPPSILDSFMALKAAGFKKVIAVPLLFTSAYHANSDTPAALEAAKKATGLEYYLSPVIGLGDDLAQILIAKLNNLRKDLAEVIFLAVGSSRAGANEAVIKFGEKLSSKLDCKVKTVFATSSPNSIAYLEKLAEEGSDHSNKVLLPLFSAPGLLLDKSEALAQNLGITCLPPLGNSISPIIVKRFEQTLAAIKSS